MLAAAYSNDVEPPVASIRIQIPDPPSPRRRRACLVGRSLYSNIYLIYGECMIYGQNVRHSGRSRMRRI